MLSEDLTTKNIIFYSLSFLMVINIIFFSSQNEMRLDAEFCLAGYFSAWQACIAAALPNCIYWKRKRGNPISHLSNLLSSSDPLFSAHFKIFQHQKYWHTNPIGIINFAPRIYIDLHRMPRRLKKSTRFQNSGLECKDFKIWYNLMAS